MEHKILKCTIQIKESDEKETEQNENEQNEDGE